MKNHYVRKYYLSIALIAMMMMVTTIASAAEKIRIASVAWTGVTIKSELAVSLLKSLGYEAENKVYGVPFVYAALSSDSADVFFGNWMPSMATVANKFFSDGSVIKYVANMPGAKYTLAVPSYCADGGLKDFSDIVKYGEKLDWKIHGIEAGNDGNLIIRNMIENNLFGLGKFEIMPSSEVAMLAEVQSRVKQKRCIVFLGWSPHSMNERIDMTYLTGSTDATFGPNDGTATVWTNIRKGFDQEQPNVAQLVKNMTFSIDMMNQIMTAVYADKGLKPEKAGLAWLKDHPDVYRAWLKGVTTSDGKDSVAAFEDYLRGM
ncbi:ABC-type glycine betaine/proline transport system, periplasmic binding protein [Desulfosarcina variabilis str. Montpellier]|uniref:glycine betaine ABC transporter substrate-binding protein n=1 Tax=Desulfosarcina variabilis TaxID=2300 RepID=UPI003AFA4F54